MLGLIDCEPRHAFHGKALSLVGMALRLPQRLLSGQGKVDPIPRRAAVYAVFCPCHKCIEPSPCQFTVESAAQHAHAVGAARPHKSGRASGRSVHALGGNVSAAAVVASRGQSARQRAARRGRVARVATLARSATWACRAISVWRVHALAVVRQASQRSRTGDGCRRRKRGASLAALR